MKSSRRWLASALWVLSFVCFASNLSLGQGSKQTSEYEPIKDPDRDNPKARDQWFMRGRTAPNGESAALLRYQAYQQKLQLRRQQFAARAMVAVPHVSSSGWNALGPAPLASDATPPPGGFQDYHQVSGRATAVAIDPADTTGNTVYIGGAHGGVWKSTNAGPASVSAASVAWTPVLDYESTLAVGAIAIQPGNTDPTKSVIVVGTGEPNSSADSYYGLGILRSADGGQTWSLIPSANGGARSFAGMGFSKIAFNSTPGKTNVVVAAAAAAESFGLDTTGANRGLYYSQDSGQTWNYATVQDSGVTVDPGSATSVVYNQTAGMFFAALRYHGFYSSTDGITWSRLASQPASLTTGLCPTPHNTACPIYRAEMAVVPGRNEMYTWVVAFDSTGNEVDRGIWSRNATTGAWAQIADSGITTCEGGSNTDGCGVQQGSYNLELAAVPDGSTATDLYPGAINIYKCTITNPTAAAPSCASQFMNLTHVYGCSPILSSLAHVHPDQHALDFMLAGSPAKAVMYFANDGGIYRAVDGYTGLTTGDCSATNAFDSLNGTIGSMTQFVWFSVHPTDANTLLGGTQDNGSPATTSATTSTSWGNVQGGDGGYNAISPANGTDWYAAGPDVPPGSLAINHCTAGLSCNNNTFTPVVIPSQVGTDDGAFYFPYMLDPQAPTRLIIGTCRVWRGGPSTSASGTYTALSNNFDKGSATACAGNEINLVRSLAAGGPTDANGSKVIYAGTDGLGGSTSPAGGRVLVTTTGAAPMTDVTGSINPTQYPVSGIAVDTSDATGQTAFVTIMGFHVAHVFKKTNAGASWTNFTASLPDSPADTVVVDPQAHVVYVGTDVGVFSSSTASASWTEVGPLAAAGNTGYLPNVPVTALAIFNSGGKKLLRASTYGRGIWEYNLSTTADYQIAISNPTLTIFPTQTATFIGTLTAVNSYSSAVTLSCSGTLKPTTCTPNPNPVIPTAAPAAAFTVGASGAVGDYPFNVHGVGADAATTTHDAAVTLHIVDFGLGAPSPASVSVQQGNTSSGVAFVVTGAGSFNGTVTLACPASGMPTAVTCTFSPSASVSALPATVTLTFKTTASTPAATTPITISATTPNAPAAKTQSVNLTVTTISPDYTLTISNSPLSATVNTSGTFTGTLTALNGYASAVNLSCGTGAPPTCTVTPASVTPTVAGTPFTVTVQSNLAQTYNFSVSGAGTDTLHVAHATAVVFNSLFTFTVADTSTTQSVRAGQTASYSLTVTPVGSNTFPAAVSFTCSNWSPSQPAGAACSAVTQVSAGATGVQTVTLNITTAGLGKTQIRPVAKNVAPFILWVSAVGMVIGGFGRKSWSRKKGMVAIGLVVLLASAIMLPACGGSSAGGAGGGGGISVNVTPKTAGPFPTQQQQFTAVVNGNTNQQVTWQVSGVTGGNTTVGTIDTTGLYTAPGTVPSPNPVTVSAVAQAEVTKSDSAMVTIKTPTPSGTYTVTVTATAGTVTQTTSAVLTVQ